MKRIFLISASLLIVSTVFAQSDANSDNALYKFDNPGTAKTVRHLGSAPEFPFLRNKTSSYQVYATIRRHENDHSRSMDKLNGLLMQIGYANGVRDLRQTDITEAHIQPGTEGNMGSRGYTYGYYRLEGNTSEFKAWRIAANTTNNNGYAALYIFAKCGNAFYPRTNATACVNVPVNLTGDMNQITLKSSGSKVTNNEQVFVYYSRKHGRHHENAYPIADISDKYPSTPIMLSNTQDVSIKPETYNVTVSSPENSVFACPDSTLNIAANINVEKTSSYTGNYPGSDHKIYRKVTKHQYKLIARKMRRIKRKEAKIARRTGMTVDVSNKA